VPASPTDEQLITRWQDEPAPLLPLLHAFNERDGHLSRESLEAISAGLRIPLAEVHGSVTFYHHISDEPESRDRPRVCMGPICRLNGSEQLLHDLDGAEPMACAGRCDDPIPVLQADRGLVGRPGDELQQVPSPLPPPNPAGIEECCLANVREPDRAACSGYVRTGGYAALAKARAMEPEEILQVLEASGLAGRGGAGFPTATKWRAVRDAQGGPKTLVCNADEGEPGCFKDRVLLDHDPHAILEGMAIAGLATGATRGFIYLRYEYPQTQAILERALEEAEEHLDGFEFCVRRGAGAYICGEETSLLNSLEGRHPFPRNRPPFPVTHGFEQTPTAVNNVETLASVAPILHRGAEWYAGLGLGEHRGTKLISLSGDVERPGNYEIPMGFPLKTLLFDWAGVPEGRTVQAVTMAGLSGGFLGAEDLDVTLDEACLRAKGSFLGAGGIMVFDDRRDMFEIARQSMEFFASESCGKCFPCRIGTERLVERLGDPSGPLDPAAWTEEVRAIGQAMTQLSACGLGRSAPLITESLLRLFPAEVSGKLGAE
jgi:NADH-quinone oxidoreductase subunit F